MEEQASQNLFDEVLVENTKVVAVMPRPELKPFFKLNLGCQTVNIDGEPDRIRTGDLHRDRVAC